MRWITPAMLKRWFMDNRLKAEGILPKIIKKLVYHSYSNLNSLHIPEEDDIWVKGYDGIIEYQAEHSFIPKGLSVWEFGVSNFSLKKINSDYDKRTNDSRGVDRSQTTFCLVIPKLWAYKISVSEWKKEHNDWKEVRVYDASILCDWINSDMLTVVWLMEEFEGVSPNYLSIANAWQRFSDKTNPRLTFNMFLNGREDQNAKFIELLSNKAIIKVKGDSTIDASGFVLSALSQHTNYHDRTIVVFDKQTYERIVSLYSHIVIFLDFDFSYGDCIIGENTVIFRFNKESSIKADIEILPLSKYRFQDALLSMGIKEYETDDIYIDTRSNLRALIRKIPGNSIDAKPEWSKIQENRLLLPLLFVRFYNRNKEYDKTIIEKLGGKAYSVFEEKYLELLKLEDSPIKEIQGIIYIINYEEIWEVLCPSTNDDSFDRLTSVVIDIMQSYITDRVSYSGNDQTLRNLLVNYITLSYNDDNTKRLREAISRILAYIHDSRTQKLVLYNLSILAEATPELVMDFLFQDYKSNESIIKSLFFTDQKSTDYTYVLFALEKLSLFPNTVREACLLLFDLYCGREGYILSNSPQNSLKSILHFNNREGTLLLHDKVVIIQQFIVKNPNKGGTFVIDLLNTYSFSKSVRHGEKQRSTNERITYDDYFSAIEEVAIPVFDYAIEIGNLSLLKGLLMKYGVFKPSLLAHYAERFNRAKYSVEDVIALNYEIRKRIMQIIKYNKQEKEMYLKELRNWIKVTSLDDPVYRIAWMFQEVYSCPTEELLRFDDDYDYTTSIAKFREKAAAQLLKIDYEKRIDVLLHLLKDEYAWGVLLNNITIEDSIKDDIIQRLLHKGRIKTLGGFFNSVPLKYYKAAFINLSESDKNRIIAETTRTDIIDLLENEEQRIAYWASKTMIQYDEKTYISMLKYNPYGLVLFCYKLVKKDPSHSINLVAEVLSSIVNYVDSDRHMDCSSPFDHEIETIIESIDQVHYSEEWAKLCWKLLQIKSISRISEGVRKLFFYNPNDFVTIINKSDDTYYYFKNYFQFPLCAFDNFDAFSFFAHTLKNSQNEPMLGSIIGRSIREEDGWNPHPFACRIIEEIDNPTLDSAVYMAYYYKQEAHFILDGTEQKEKSEYFKKLKQKYTFQYPHVASILKQISDNYEEEAQHDRVYSEMRTV